MDPDYKAYRVREAPYPELESAVRLGPPMAPPPRLLDGGLLVADAFEHGSVALFIDMDKLPVHPELGAWKRLSLVFSPAGFPSTNLDGESILDLVAPQAGTGWRTLIHRGMGPGLWGYFAVFLKYEDGGDWEWVDVGRRDVLMPSNFRYGDRLFDKMPIWYQRADTDEGHGLLRAFLDAVGYATDVNRTWAQTGSDVWSPRFLSSRILPQFGEMLGLPYEAASGDKRYRKLAANIITLRKRKGSAPGLDGHLSALSGYRTLAYDGPNLLFTYDADGAPVVGPWSAPVTTNFTRVLIDKGVAGAPQVDTHSYRMQRASTSGQNSMVFGESAAIVAGLVPIGPGVGRSLRLSFHARSNTTIALSASIQLVDIDGTVVATRTPADVTVTTSWGRFKYADAAVPDAARFARITLTTPSMTTAQWVDVAQPMLVSSDWRPEALPGRALDEPLSDALANPLSYVHPNYYEPPRTAWVNVYPQRTNFALNSNFSLNNLPAGAWSQTEESTYRTLPIAYADYTGVAAGEDDYNDLASGFNTLSLPTTLVFDTANNRLTLSPDEAPWVATVKAAAFPVIPGQAYSAALQMASSVQGTTARLAIYWQSGKGFETQMMNDDGTPMGRRTVDLPLTTDVSRVEVRNAIAPEGAQFARLVVETFNSVDRTDYIQKALIENNAVPGGYFDGDEENGAVGDFSFIGTPHQSYSVYYMNRYLMVDGANPSARMRTVLKDLLPSSLTAKLMTAHDGLYHV